MEAYAALAKLQRTAHRDDADIPLYMELGGRSEAREWDKAQAAFTQGAGAGQGSLAGASYGLGRAQLALGDKVHAKDSFQKVFDKDPDQRHFGAGLGIVELDTVAHDDTGRREKELGVLCEKAPEAQTANPRDRSRALDPVRRGGHGGLALRSRQGGALPAPPSSSTIATSTP